MGPPGPQGLQGAIGSIGINDSQVPPGPPGRPGASNLTLCQYRKMRGTTALAGPAAYSEVTVHEHPVCVILNLDINCIV